MRVPVPLAALAFALALAACAATPPPRTYPGDPAVRRAYLAAHPATAPRVADGIRRGEVLVGMSPVEAAAAAGKVLDPHDVPVRAMTELVLPGWRVWVFRGRVVEIVTGPGR